MYWFYKDAAAASGGKILTAAVFGRVLKVFFDNKVTQCRRSKRYDDKVGKISYYMNIAKVDEQCVRDMV